MKRTISGRSAVRRFFYPAIEELNARLTPAVTGNPHLGLTEQLAPHAENGQDTQTTVAAQIRCMSPDEQPGQQSDVAEENQGEELILPTVPIEEHADVIMDENGNPVMVETTVVAEEGDYVIFYMMGNAETGEVAPWDYFADFTGEAPEGGEAASSGIYEMTGAVERGPEESESGEWIDPIIYAMHGPIDAPPTVVSQPQTTDNAALLTGLLADNQQKDTGQQAPQTTHNEQTSSITTVVTAGASQNNLTAHSLDDSLESGSHTTKTTPINLDGIDQLVKLN
jgi:hypothetical protein